MLSSLDTLDRLALASIAAIGLGVGWFVHPGLGLALVGCCGLAAVVYEGRRPPPKE
jgi:hypothetical protein